LTGIPDLVNLIFDMVNHNKLSTKAYVLKRLREAERPLTGNELGKDAGVSRVAIWKGVHGLQASGYSITGDEAGYRIKKDAASDSEPSDFLYPWEFAEREGNFHYWENTDSTMNRARELAEKGAAGGAVITAGTQTTGRGRNGRPWASRAGGLFFTLLERPGCPVIDYTRYSLMLLLAARKAIGNVSGKKARLRWPNDIYVENRKIAGVLTELHGEGDRLKWLSLGIGVNVNNPVPVRNMVNCAELAGRPLSRRELLLSILEEWSALKASDIPPGELCRLWNRSCDGIGRTVALARNRAEEPEGGQPDGTGVFLGTDFSGRALLRCGKTIKRLAPGKVSLRYIR
jgi:BirA family biotin operon repressor/biotin-[acetyl-CoA-carboxylase] ligase